MEKLKTEIQCNKKVDKIQVSTLRRQPRRTFKCSPFARANAEWLTLVMSNMLSFYTVIVWPLPTPLTRNHKLGAWWLALQLAASKSLLFHCAPHSKNSLWANQAGKVLVVRDSNSVDLNLTQVLSPGTPVYSLIKLRNLPSGCKRVE